MANAKKTKAEFTVTLELTQDEGAALELLLRDDEFPHAVSPAYEALQDIWAALSPFYLAPEDA